jgi:hypothetical protein
MCKEKNLRWVLARRVGTPEDKLGTHPHGGSPKDKSQGVRCQVSGKKDK